MPVYMVLWTFVVLALFVGDFDQSEALKCMECGDVPHPSFCDKIVTCPDNSVCNRFSKRADDIQSDTEDASLDSNVCEECCRDQDFCNMKGCGQSVAPLSQRGPYCYECAVENEKYGCRTLSPCAQHESCMLTTGKFPGTYKSGCTAKTVNKTILSVDRSSGTDVHGGWSSWNAWSSCSKTCGVGTKLRQRTCHNNVHICPGDAYEVHSCHLYRCPVDGGWSPWNAWSSCSKTCDTGTKRRNRTCDNPASQHNGMPCHGAGLAVHTCLLSHCPAHGGWSSWNEWSSCPKTCGVGRQFRHRTCHNQGHPCPGAAYEVRSCNFQRCPANSDWTAWSLWGACVGPCNNTNKYRFRKCNTHNCHGTAHEMKVCSNHQMCSDSRCSSSRGFHVVNLGTQRLCLYLSQRTYSWDESREKCHNKGGELVSIGNRDVDYAIRTFLQGQLTPCANRCHLDEKHSFAWLGLHSHSVHNHYVFKWTNQSSPFNYNDLYDLQGNDAPKDNRCAVIGPNLYDSWYSIHCVNHFRFLCEIKLG